MRVTKVFDRLGSLSLTNVLLVSFLAGLIFPMSSWLIDIIINNTPITPDGIWSMHLRNPVHFITDIIPFLIAAAVWYTTYQRMRDRKFFQSEQEYRNAHLNKNAQFAMDIGAGNFERQFVLDNQDDVLGKSLLLMRDNLLASSRKEKDETWISEGKDLVSNILRINNKLDELSHEVIVNLIRYTSAIQGALYLYDEDEEILISVATYAYNRKKFINERFRIGQGLIGQCAYERDIIYRTEIPDHYITITSGILGDKKPKSLLIVPLITDEKLQGVIEFASLENEIPDLTIRFMRELGEIIARTIFNLRVNERTEKLLLEAQKMTQELQENEEQLRQSAEEMRATQEELQKSNEKLETQIIEVENAQKRLHSLLENASEIISIYDEKMVLKYISPSVTKIFGYTPAEMIKGKDFDRLTRRGEADLRSMFNELLAHPEEPRILQYTYMKKDGEKIFIETVGRNLLHDTAIGGIIFNTQDITARKKAEKEERMKSKMQSLSENSLDMIIRLSTTGQFFYANAVIEDYIGLSPKDVMNKTISEVALFEGLYSYFDQTIKQIKSSPQKTITELHLPILMGEKASERIMSIDAIPEFNENELETILFVGHDITEAKRIEMEIQEKNKKIGDSINYAKRIQKAILPDNQLIREYLPRSFIYYRPRDVVSGDFPWFFIKGDNLYIAVVDCTGHGVPGAMLSFVGYFLLNNIVDREHDASASKVLDMLHMGVRSTLKQDKQNAEGRDGMDIALCKINLKNKEVQFAGAHRPLYFIRKGELTEFKGDRKPIGGIPLGNKPEVDFANHIIQVTEGDRIFFFSDGLPDQLGGAEKKKYGPAKIREAILQNNDFSMPRFNDYFENDFEQWKKGLKQIDDVLLIGIEF
jgi:PAS domain S-box-containing protein